MIQWLHSKLALIVVGLVLISSITTMFYLQRRSLEREELMDRCREISRLIEEVDNIEADIMRQKISFDEDSQSFYVNPEVGGERYTIEIYEDLVMLETESESVTTALNAEVHLWAPEELNETGSLSRGEEGWRDSRAEPLEIDAGEQDILLRKLKLDCEGTTRSHVFISEVDIP